MSEPEPFIVDPIHQVPGPNTWSKAGTFCLICEKLEKTKGYGGRGVFHRWFQQVP
jgi:hypothetical protein